MIIIILLELFWMHDHIGPGSFLDIHRRLVECTPTSVRYAHAAMPVAYALN
jgi:hypothetical protein